MSAPTNLSARGGIRDLPSDWAPGTEWTPPPADPRLIGDINRGYQQPRYAQPNTFRPTLRELVCAVRRLWCFYRCQRRNP